MNSLHQSEHDLEAASPLPRDDDHEEELGEASATFDGEQPSRSASFAAKRRRRAMFAVVAVAIAAAIGTGVALVARPGSKATPQADQAAATSGGAPSGDNNQGAYVAGGAPSDNGDQESPSAQDIPLGVAGESSSSEAQPQEVVEPSPAVATAAQADNTATSGPQQEQQEAVDQQQEVDDVLDSSGADATQDYDEEYPEDIIYDQGYEQPEEPHVELIFYDTDQGEGKDDGLFVTSPVEEKVPFKSEDLAVLQQQTGSFNDFVVTPDIARISVSSNNKCANADEGLWQMNLDTDSYPWETAWAMRDENGKTVMSGPPEGRNYDRLTKYVGKMCIKAGLYTITLTDKSEDGICCSYGPGVMTIQVNGKKVVETKDTPFKTFKREFVIAPIGTSSVTTPSPTPTPMPTKRPTPATPMPNPVPVIDQSNMHNVTIVVQTDNFGQETGVSLVPITGGQPVLRYNRGDFGANTKYVETNFVPTGRYNLCAEDTFMGLENGGFIALEVDGEKVVDITTWNTRESQTKCYVIDVGRDFTEMTSQEQLWLNEHNNRRRAYYESVGARHRPLAWSEQLAAAADAWLDTITPTCKISRQPGLVEGENMAARQSAAGRNEGPRTIMRRWYDQKINLPYPQNNPATQILWSATRFLGCASKTVEMADGETCYVSACRYSRPGNCAMGQYSSWQEAVLAERSKCGDPCVGGECY